MENIIGLIIQLISGAAGGNIAGALLKNISLGTLWSSVAGIVGGGLGGQILRALLGTGAATAAAGVVSMWERLSRRLLAVVLVALS